jgi:hypothetical protein
VGLAVPGGEWCIVCAAVAAVVGRYRDLGGWRFSVRGARARLAFSKLGEIWALALGRRSIGDGRVVACGAFGDSGGFESFWFGGGVGCPEAFVLEDGQSVGFTRSGGAALVPMHHRQRRC